MIKISIIVPVYNTSKYLRKCLDSLVNQTLQDIEIIVIDDCSTDESREILKLYDGYKNITIIYNEMNKGIGYTRNKGLEVARGDYIAFVDSDDFVDLTMYEKMYSKAIDDGLDMVICRFHKLIDHRNGSYEEVTPDYVIPFFENTTFKENPNLLLDVNMAPWNKIYKRELFKDVRFPENLKYEDAIVVVKTMVRAKKIGMLEDKLNYYIVRNNSESTTVDERIFDIIEIDQQMCDELKKQEYYEEIYDYVQRKMVRSMNYFINQQSSQANNKLSEKFTRDAYAFLTNNFPNWER